MNYYYLKHRSLIQNQIKNVIITLTKINVSNNKGKNLVFPSLEENEILIRVHFLIPELKDPESCRRYKLTVYKVKPEDIISISMQKQSEIGLQKKDCVVRMIKINKMKWEKASCHVTS